MNIPRKHWESTSFIFVGEEPLEICEKLNFEQSSKVLDFLGKEYNGSDNVFLTPYVSDTSCEYRELEKKGFEYDQGLFDHPKKEEDFILMTPEYAHYACVWIRKEHL